MQTFIFSYMQPMSRRGTVMSNASKGNPNYLIRNELTGKITCMYNDCHSYTVQALITCYIVYRHTAVDERKYPPVESK